jgi:hypothetical protein
LQNKWNNFSLKNVNTDYIIIAIFFEEVNNSLKQTKEKQFAKKEKN